MIVFIEIFDEILTECIQFPMTKPQPLLPHQSLMQQNEFRSKCQDFIMHYNFEWNGVTKLHHNDGNGSTYTNDKHRAKKVNDSLRECLLKCKNLLINANKQYMLPMIANINIKTELRHSFNYKSNIIKNNNLINNNYNFMKNENDAININDGINMNGFVCLEPCDIYGGTSCSRSCSKNIKNITNRNINNGCNYIFQQQQQQQTAPQPQPQIQPQIQQLPIINNINNNNNDIVSLLQIINHNQNIQSHQQQFVNNNNNNNNQIEQQRPQILRLSRPLTTPTPSTTTTFTPISGYNPVHNRSNFNISSQSRYNPLLPLTPINMNSLNMNSINVNGMNINGLNNNINANITTNNNNNCNFVVTPNHLNSNLSTVTHNSNMFMNNNLIMNNNNNNNINNASNQITNSITNSVTNSISFTPSIDVNLTDTNNLLSALSQIPSALHPYISVNIHIHNNDDQKL